jgi:hypothetical protein
MNAAMQEGLDCETSSLYKGASFRPCFTLLWTNWLLLYALVTVTAGELRRSLGVVSALYLMLTQLIPSTEIKVTNYQPHCLGLSKGVTIMFLPARLEKSAAIGDRG